MTADEENDRWRNGSHFVNGFRQFYREHRPRDGSGLPVLALHGSLTQSGVWTALAEAAGSIRMLCPDQRGFGRSEDPGSDLCAEFASDALTLAQVLLPDRYAIMGHSFACSIALEAAKMASTHVAAIILVDPVVRGANTVARPASSSTAPLEYFSALEDAERHFQETEEGKWTGAALRRFVQDIMMRDAENGTWRLPYTPARLRRLRSFTASDASDYDLFTKAKAVRCPVLVFRGGLSKRFPPAAEQPFLEAFASRPKLVLCPESGHFPTATDTRIVASELVRFLNDIR
jgi:pimeloyl-ACP methyl ester carboxylesterase